MRYIVEQGQTTGSRQKIVLSGCSFASRFTRLISVPTAQIVPAGDSRDHLDDELGRAVHVGRLPPPRAGTPDARSRCTPGYSRRACSICSTQKRWCVEHQPLPQDDARVAPASRRPRCRRSPRAGSRRPSAPAGIPSSIAVLRPRCSSGKKSTRRPRANAQRSTFSALDDVQTMPPLRPQNALRFAAEFMYVTGMTGCTAPSASVTSSRTARPAPPSTPRPRRCSPCRPSSSQRRGWAGSPAGAAPLRMSALSAMKWTPQKTMYSASGRSAANCASLNESPRAVGVLDDLVALVVVAEDHQPLAQRRPRRARYAGPAPRRLISAYSRGMASARSAPRCFGR